MGKVKTLLRPGGEDPAKKREKRERKRKKNLQRKNFPSDEAFEAAQAARSTEARRDRAKEKRWAEQREAFVKYRDTVTSGMIRKIVEQINDNVSLELACQVLSYPYVWIKRMYDEGTQPGVAQISQELRDAVFQAEGLHKKRLLEQASNGNRIALETLKTLWPGEYNKSRRKQLEYELLALLDVVKNVVTAGEYETILDGLMSLDHIKVLTSLDDLLLDAGLSADV